HVVQHRAQVTAADVGGDVQAPRDVTVLDHHRRRLDGHTRDIAQPYAVSSGCVDQEVLDARQPASRPGGAAYHDLEDLGLLVEAPHLEPVHVRSGRAPHITGLD